MLPRPLQDAYAAALERYPTVARFVMFCIVGFSGMIIDLITVASVMALTDLWFGWARMASFVTAVSWNFTLDDSITFAGEEGETRHHSKPVRFALFVATCSVGMALNWLTSTGLYENVAFFQEHYLLASITGVVAGSASNFAGSLFVVFRPKG